MLIFDIFFQARRSPVTQSRRRKKKEKIMSKTHDEQSAELFSYQAEVSIMKRKERDGNQLTKRDITRLQEISQALPELRLAMNHYPEVKVPLFIAIKNLLLNELK